jgi:hypothetical protein
MINIKKYEKNIIYYECSCGVKGVCSFKPMNREAAIVIDIKCPACQDTERLTLIQYNNEDSKRTMIDNISNIDLSWVPSINEEVLYNGDE